MPVLRRNLAVEVFRVVPRLPWTIGEGGIMKKAARRALLARVEHGIAEKQELEEIRRRRVLGRVDLSKIPFQPRRSR